MESPDVETIDDRHAPQLIGFSDAYASLDPPSGHPHGEPVGIVVSSCALCVFGSRLATEFSPPDYQGFVQQASLLEVLEQSGDRLIGRTGMLGVVEHEVAVGIPVGVVVVAAGIHLDEPDSSFHESTGQKALSSEILCSRTVDAIETLGVFGFGVEIHGFGAEACILQVRRRRCGPLNWCCRSVWKDAPRSSFEGG